MLVSSVTEVLASFLSASGSPAHLWPVGGPHQQHPATGTGRVAALHLHQHLSLEAPAGFMLTCSHMHTYMHTGTRRQAGTAHTIVQRQCTDDVQHAGCCR